MGTKIIDLTGGRYGQGNMRLRFIQQLHRQRAMNLAGVVYETCDELIVTKSLRERKAIMDERSDAFIALPGGFGTIEELLEIITLKQLKYHNRPVVILNVNGYFDALLEQFRHIMNQRFAKPESSLLYYVTADVEDALEYIDTYEPIEFRDKRLTRGAGKRLTRGAGKRLTRGAGKRPV
jgi:uncharacterized protein (TIGR00730 family)